MAKAVQADPQLGGEDAVGGYKEKELSVVTATQLDRYTCHAGAYLLTKEASLTHEHLLIAEA